LREENFNQEDALTASLRLVMMPFAGGFTVRAIDGLNATPLITTSPDAKMVNAFTASMPGPEKMRDARSVGAMPLAVRLFGSFPSAFPDGKPVREGDRAPASATNHLARSATNTVVVLVGDVDFVFDQYAFRMMNIMGQTLAEMVNDNFSFMLNLVEQGTGNTALIGQRSRGVLDRSFTRVREIEEAAQRRWQAEELKLTEKLQQTQERLNELQTTRDDQQQFILSPEQQAEMEDFRKIRFETQRELKDVRRNLRRDIEQLGLQVKVVNLAVVPALVAVYGLVRGWRRRRA
jgi:hypothetical protein